MKTGSHSDRSERTTGEPETAETAARQPEGSAACPATRSHRQIDGSALTSNEQLTPGVVVRMLRRNVETAKALDSPFACVAQDVATFAAEQIENMQEEIGRYKAWATSCDPKSPDETKKDGPPMRTALELIRDDQIPQGMSPALFADRVLRVTEETTGNPMPWSPETTSPVPIHEQPTENGETNGG